MRLKLSYFILLTILSLSLNGEAICYGAGAFGENFSGLQPSCGAFNTLINKEAVTSMVLLDTQKQEDLAKWGADVNLIAVSVWRVQKLGKNISFGIELGALPDFVSYTIFGGKYFTKRNTLFSDNRVRSSDNKYGQLLNFQTFVRWRKPDEPLFEIDAGLKGAYYGYAKEPVDDDYQWRPFFGGVFVRPTYKIKKITVGIRVDTGVMIVDFWRVNEFIVLFSPLIRFKF